MVWFGYMRFLYFITQKLGMSAAVRVSTAFSLFYQMMKDFFKILNMFIKKFVDIPQKTEHLYQVIC